MATTNPDDPGMGPDDFDEKPYGEEPMDVEDDAPRRAASARFIVDSEVGSEAVLRDAMDPANQSLADALRLSYRLLQFFIVVLVIMFLASGFHTVDEGEVGVLTIWGRIKDREGDPVLRPGPKFTVYPSPAGEFVTFKETRDVELGTAFAPDLHGRSRQEIQEAAEVSTPLNPGRDGSVITLDGDLAHLELGATITIEDPVKFVENVADADRSRDATRLARLALQAAAIEVAAGSTLTDLSDEKKFDEARDKIRQAAQRTLDGLQCGIRITQVQKYQGYAPLAIEKTKTDLVATKEAARQRRLDADKNRGKRLTEVAGAKYGELLEKIGEYEAALDRNDQAAADSRLAAINQMLDSPAVTGEASMIINYAKTYKSQIDTTLGAQAHYFQEILPAFRANPQLVVNRLWMEAKSNVMQKNDAELLYVPDDLQSMLLNLNGSHEIAEIRMRQAIERMKALRNKGANPLGTILHADEMANDKSGRQKVIDKTGGLSSLGSNH